MGALLWSNKIWKTQQIRGENTFDFYSAKTLAELHFTLSQLNNLNWWVSGDEDDDAPLKVLQKFFLVFFVALKDNTRKEWEDSIKKQQKKGEGPSLFKEVSTN